MPAPRGLALLMALGPGLVWCGEFIGSGEVILATRNGAIFGIAILWVPILATFAKFWIGLGGAHYTVTTGEGMIDMMGRVPGPKNWVVWPVFVVQIVAGAFSTGALATVTSYLLHYFFPGILQFVLGWIAVVAVIAITWSGAFEPLKQAMSLLVLLIIVGTLAVAVRTWPGMGAVLGGMFGFHIPAPADWALEQGLVTRNTVLEILPLLGWAAGGFASQVWYTYWVMGAGYGATRGRGWGKPLDEAALRAFTVEDATQIRGWRRVVTADASIALVIGAAVTAAFLLAGSSVLRPLHIAPNDVSIATELSSVVSAQWGAWAGHLFVLAGVAAMLSTMLGQFAGWPRLLADCMRVLFPSSQRLPWKYQFRAILLLFAVSNFVIVYSLGLKPVKLVQFSAILDGVFLIPLEALAVGIGLYVVMPRFFSEDVKRHLRPNPIFVVGLALAFVVYGYTYLHIAQLWPK
jgi:Mn2+/Fe2+ NRAMP family transporter